MKTKVLKFSKGVFVAFMLLGILSVIVNSGWTVQKFAASKIQK